MTTRTSAATPTVAPLSIVDGTHGELRPRWKNCDRDLGKHAVDYLDSGEATSFMAAYFASKFFGLDLERCEFSGWASENSSDLAITVRHQGLVIREVHVQAENTVDQTIAAGHVFVDLDELGAMGLDIIGDAGKNYRQLAGLPSNAPLIFEAEITPDLRKLSLEVSLLW